MLGKKKNVAGVGVLCKQKKTGSYHCKFGMMISTVDLNKLTANGFFKFKNGTTSESLKRVVPKYLRRWS
jgi:hypothetical protein